MKIFCSFITIWALIIIFQVKCTENPFWGSDKITDMHSEIKGTVQLSDYTNPDGVYVWFVVRSDSVSPDPS